MKLIKIFFAALCLVNFLTFAQDANKTRSFKVSKGGELEVSLSVGDINIDTWNKDEILIEYSRDKSENNYNQFEISQDGNSITVRSNLKYLEHIEISVPEHFNVELKTSAGNININDKVIGNIEAKTAGGNINLKEVKGNVELSTAGGNINTGKINGSADISSSGGDIKLENISGNAEVKTAGGNITMKNVGGDAEIKTAGGNISIQNIDGNAEVKSGGGNIAVGHVAKSAEVKTGGGNIDIKSANGKVEAKTGSGDVTLNNITGSVEASAGAGSIYVELIPKGKLNSEIQTGAGDIKLYVPEDAKAVIDVEASDLWGSNGSEIKSDFKEIFSQDYTDENHKRYVLNGGGVKISLETHSGVIEIRKLK